MQTTRRHFLGALGAGAIAATIPRRLAQARVASHKPILLFNCDFNWVRGPATEKHPTGEVRPSMPEDWSEVDAREYFDWHRRFGNNVMYCQAYCHTGFALYPSKLGPVGKGNAANLFPALYELSRNAGMPVWSYFNVSYDFFATKKHPEWIIPGTVIKHQGPGGFIGPETPYIDLLCKRVQEFLKQYPVDWLLFDWFSYGPLHRNGLPVRPAEFVKRPFRRIIGRPMPQRAEDITAEENLIYKRTVLAEQFQKLKSAVKDASPTTKVIFNVPYYEPQEALWAGHPMLTESDGLFAESSDDVVDWLLEVRRPSQRVMTTIIGRDGGVSDPNTWEKWYRRGCDFFGYAWATPPRFEPTAYYAEQLDITRKAFAAMAE